MGKTDAKTNEYMSDAGRFADLFNFFLYDGEQVIRPENLKEMDRTALALPFGDGAKPSEVIQKYRDLLRLLSAMSDSNAAYLLLGLENQSEASNAMPAKNMLYDAAEYVRQVEASARSHREHAKNHPGESRVSPGEFLSGFHKGDRLLPVITLVVLWSPDEWDGPRSIHEMLAVKDERLLKFIPTMPEFGFRSVMSIAK